MTGQRGNVQRISSPSPPGPAARLDLAARLRDDVLHDREAEAGAARRARAIAAEEALEQRGSSAVGTPRPLSATERRTMSPSVRAEIVQRAPSPRSGSRS